MPKFPPVALETLIGRWALSQAHRGALDKIMVFQGPDTDPIEEDKPGGGDLTWARYMEVGRYHISALIPYSYALTGMDAPGAGVIRCQPFPIPCQMSFDQIYASVAIGVAGKNFRLGLYNSNSASYPDALQVDSGDIASTPEAAKYINISLTLPAGLYWVAIIAEDAAIKFFYDDPNFVHPILGHIPLSYGVYDWTLTSSYGALPDPFPSGATRARKVYDMGLRRSA